VLNLAWFKQLGFLSLNDFTQRNLEWEFEFSR